MCDGLVSLVYSLGVAKLSSSAPGGEVNTVENVQWMH